MRSSRFLAVLVALAATGLTAQTIGLRPGRYDVVTETESPAGKTPAEKEVVCFTADQAKNLVKDVISELGGDCKIADSKASSSELTASATCSAGKSVLGMNLKMTFATESFTVLATVTENGKPLTKVRRSGKRQGDCSN